MFHCVIMYFVISLLLNAIAFRCLIFRQLMRVSIDVSVCVRPHFLGTLFDSALLTARNATLYATEYMAVYVYISGQTF